jgi:bla regulator protein BlaR1
MMPLQSLANHLWQSTLFAAVAGLLTLLLRKNRAQTRYWLWLAASVKFLIPFSILVATGSHFARHTATAMEQSLLPSVIEQVSQPFAAPVTLMNMPAAQPSSAIWIPAILCAVWAIGFVTLACSWWLRWRSLRAALRTSSPLHLPIDIEVLTSPAFAEPGVFGIRRPVLLLPAGITHSLTPPQLEAILAHELCHARRRDNLATAIHMTVEAVFWFHPLVWWLGARLMDERECACDEEVLLLGSEPQVYAEAILKICELYLESPLPCVSGVTGANLKKRIEAIMTNHIALRLNFAKKAALVTAGVAALAVPIVVGMLSAPAIGAQQPVAKLEFEVASVSPVQRDKLSGPGRVRYNPQGVDLSNVPLGWVIGEAYGVVYNRISSLDRRINEKYFSPAGTDYFFDIAAKAGRPVPREQIRLMLQTLLADRFSLVAHRERKLQPVYKLVVGRSGPKFQEGEAGKEPMCSLGLEGFVCRNAEMTRFAALLTQYLGGQADASRPVLDSTGLTGSYDFTLRLRGGEAGGKAALVEWLSSDVFSDIEKQLGLRLEADKGLVDYLVVDHVEKPSGN